MSYSIIFSGDLPELTYEIIKYFRKDYSTLHSCILVNRLWCRLAIPLLWEDPFSFRSGNCNFIEIYLDNLNDDFKTKLNEYKINDNSLSSNTLFNYPKFLKYLNTLNFVLCVDKWFDVAVRTSKSGNRYFLKNLSNYSIFDFKNLINMLLFKMFIENEVNLYTFEIEIFYNDYYSHTYFNNILALILQNTNFIHNMRNLNISIIDDSSDNSNEHKLIKNRISQVTNSHQNLKKILITFKNLPLYQSLLLSKDSNCANTLNTIIFFHVDFKGIINLDKVFEQLNVLESIHIFYCTLNTGFIPQISNLTKPFKLKSLCLYRLQVDEPLELLLQKSGDYLENFGYGWISERYEYYPILKQQSLEPIIKYCKNIKNFDFHGFENHIIYEAFNLIENIKQNLNYLSINVCKTSQLNINIKLSSIILRNLGQNLPSKLEYLRLILHIKTNDLEIFLKNSQHTFIKNLVINNFIRKGSDHFDILPFIKEYIMKEKRVIYLAIMDTIFENDLSKYLDDEDLSNLKDEVEEFKLHNIKVRKYHDLSIHNLFPFIKKID